MMQGDFLYMLTTPSREEMEQMIEDFGKKDEPTYREYCPT